MLHGFTYEVQACGLVVAQIEATATLISVDGDWQIQAIAVDGYDLHTSTTRSAQLPKDHALYKELALYLHCSARATIDVRWAEHKRAYPREVHA